MRPFVSRRPFCVNERSLDLIRLVKQDKIYPLPFPHPPCVLYREDGNGAFALMFKIISCQELDEEEHFTDVIDPTEDTNNPPRVAQNDVTEEPHNAVHVTSSQGHVFVDSSRTHWLPSQRTKSAVQWCRQLVFMGSDEVIEALSSVCLSLCSKLVAGIALGQAKLQGLSF